MAVLRGNHIAVITFAFSQISAGHCGCCGTAAVCGNGAKYCEIVMKTDACVGWAGHWSQSGHLITTTHRSQTPPLQAREGQQNLFSNFAQQVLNSNVAVHWAAAKHSRVWGEGGIIVDNLRKHAPLSSSPLLGAGANTRPVYFRILRGYSVSSLPRTKNNTDWSNAILLWDATLQQQQPAPDPQVPSPPVCGPQPRPRVLALATRGTRWRHHASARYFVLKRENCSYGGIS